MNDFNLYKCIQAEQFIRNMGKQYIYVNGSIYQIEHKYVDFSMGA